jgi:hypothetical protein
MSSAFFKKALRAAVFSSVVFASAALLLSPARAEGVQNTTTPEVEVVMPFSLNLFKNAYGRNMSANSLASLEPAAGDDDGDSFNAGGIALGMTEEASKKGDGTVVKLELSYSPIDKMKIKTRQGGLIMVKKFVFEPTRNVIAEQNAPPPPFWDGKAD